jgi:hypothetical protein
MVDPSSHAGWSHVDQAEGEDLFQRFPYGSRADTKTILQNDIDVLKASVCAYDAALLNKEIIQKNIAFLSFSMTWLVRLVDPRHAHPAQTIEWAQVESSLQGVVLSIRPISFLLRLPLPDEAPLRFRMLPEYLLENISDYLEFVVKWVDLRIICSSSRY